jgi:hypothetical protein
MVNKYLARYATRMFATASTTARQWKTSRVSWNHSNPHIFLFKTNFNIIPHMQAYFFQVIYFLPVFQQIFYASVVSHIRVYVQLVTFSDLITIIILIK